MGEKKRVLVADDEPNLLSMLVDFCDDMDMAAIPAENGGQCLEKARAEKPDAITVDHRMPDMLGTDVIARLKSNEATRGIPVILLSADAKMHEAEALSRGAAGVLQKPVTRAGLREMLEGCLGAL